MVQHRVDISSLPAQCTTTAELCQACSQHQSATHHGLGTAAVRGAEIYLQEQTYLKARGLQTQEAALDLLKRSVVVTTMYMTARLPHVLGPSRGRLPGAMLPRTHPSHSPWARTGWQQTLRSSMARLRRLGRFLLLAPANRLLICSHTCDQPQVRADSDLRAYPTSSAYLSCQAFLECLLVQPAGLGSTSRCARLGLVQKVWPGQKVRTPLHFTDRSTGAQLPYRVDPDPESEAHSSMQHALTRLVRCRDPDLVAIQDVVVDAATGCGKTNLGKGPGQ